jgi:hypothetical protein
MEIYGAPSWPLGNPYVASMLAQGSMYVTFQ